MDEDNNDAPRVTRARTRRLSTLDTDSRSSTPLIDATVERASPRPTRRTRLNSTTIDLRTPTRSTRLSVARGETPEPITSSVSLSATKRTLRTPAKSVRKQLALKEEVEVPDEDKDGKNSEPPKTKVDVVTEEALDSTRNTSNSSVARGETPESITPSVSLAATKRTLRTPAKSVRKQLPLKEEVEVPDEDKDGENNEASKTKVDVVTEESLDSTRNTSNSSDNILTPKVTPPTDSSRVVTRSMSKTPPVSMRSLINISQPQLDTNNSMEEKQKQTNNNTPVVEQQSLQSQSQSKLDDVWKKDIPIKAGLNNRASVKLQVKVKNISMDTPDSQKIAKEEMQIEQQDSLPDSQSKEISTTKLNEKTQEAADESQNKDNESSKVQTEEEEIPMSIQELTKTSAVTHVEPVVITDNIKKEESLPTKESKTEIVVSGGDVLSDAKDVVMESPKSQTEYITPMSVPETKVDDNTEQSEEQVVTDDKDVSMESCSDSQAEYETPKSIQEEKTNINNNKESVLDKAEHVNDIDNEVIEADATTDKSMELPVDALPTQDRKSIVKIIDDLRLPNLTPETKSRMIDKIQLDAKKVDFQSSAKADNHAKPKFPKTPARLSTTPLMALNALSDDKIDLNETPQKLIMLKKRNSSTPLAKPAEIVDESCSVPSVPPQQIDVIKSLSDLEPKLAPVVQATEEKLPRRLVSEDEDEEQEDEYAACEYFDNEVEVVEDYKSGDSMDSSERREIQENEIPHDGESVGSQDTVEDNSEDDEVGSLSSFIVSDEADHDDVDNDCENDDDDDDKDCENDDDDDHEVDDDDIGELCFSSDDASVDSDVKNNKKRRRIIVHESSEEEEQKEENNNKNKDHSIAESTKNQNNSINEKKTNKLHQSIEISKNDENAPIEREDDMEVEEVPSSSEEDVKQRVIIIGMRNKLSNKSIYEIPDSSDESQEENEDKSSTTTASTQLTDERDKQSPLNEESTSHEQSPTSLDHIAYTEQETTSLELDSAEVASTEEIAVTEGEANIPETVDQSPESQNKHKHNDDEAALLSEIASCDLSHLRKMFNPLQKSRRQTLYVKGPEMSGTEPKTKLKRRSEQFDSDFKPSQSFIETLSKETSQRLKRKHISKSFCGTTDDLDTSVVQEVQSKKPKKESVNVENVEPVETKADNLEDQPTKPEDVAKKFSDVTKDNDYYINYCDDLLQKANAAALEQKKLRIATGKKPKSLPTAAKVVIENVKIPPQTDEIAQDTEKVPKLKKNVKRLQATKQAVKHAMHLLGPDLANKEPQSLARKLSPQPQLDIKNAKTEVKKRFAKTKKPKAVAQVSPVKSSDEENHHSMKCIKTSAGYVVISKADSNRIELIKTRSGIMKVEPSTPTHKYFKEDPLTLRSRSGLSEMAVSSKAIKKKPISANHGNSTRNSATESALRFKNEIFGRAAK